MQKTNTLFGHFIDKQLLLENMLGAKGLSLTVLVDGQGRVLGKYHDAQEWDSPEALKLIGKAFRIPM